MGPVTYLRFRRSRGILVQMIHWGGAQEKLNRQGHRMEQDLELQV